MKLPKLLLSLFFLTTVYCSHLKGQTVYIAETGKKYHTKKCPEVKKTGKAIDLKQALKEGYSACPGCGADKIKLKVEKSTSKKKEE